MMTWNDLPPGVLLFNEEAGHVKLSSEHYLHFFKTQEIRWGGMHGDTTFGWSGDKGFFPVEYLY